MPRRNTANSQISTLQIFGVILAAVVTLIAVGVMFVPRKPEAPPTTRIEYAAPPIEKDTRNRETAFESGSLDFPRIGQRAERRQRTREAPTTEPTITDAEEAPYRLLGDITDSKNGQPLLNARIEAVLTSPGAPDTAFSVRSEADGSFNLPIMVAGSYRVEVLLEGYVPAKLDLVTLSDNHPDEVFNIQLSTGAKVFGQVRELGSRNPVEGLQIQAINTRTGTQRALASSQTDGQGEYAISGLEPGEYGVTVLLSNTAYKVGNELPYRKITITNPDQEHNNIDFEVDPAGVVWGYILTPNNEPVRGAEVVLTSSQSVLSQVMTAALTRQQPVRHRSESDGYYNLLGVPLNQELQVYATANNHSPQLGDPFILTPKQREVRVDIFVFNGTTVTGRVLTLDGIPVEGADVACIPSFGQLTSTMRSAQAFRGGSSGADGSYAINQLPPGSYQIYARKQGFRVNIMGEPIYPDGYSDIKNFDLYLESVSQGNHAAFGVVVDGRGVGISGAQVRLQGVSSDTFDPINLEDSTDSKGLYRFDNLAQGNYRLTVSHPEYTTRTVRKVMLDVDQRVQMSQRGLIQGRVLAKQGNSPISNFTVTAKPVQEENSPLVNMQRFMNNLPTVTVNNSPDGRFTMEVDAGYYELEAVADEYTPGKAQATVTVGQASDEVTILLSDVGGSIEGVVRTKDRGSVNGAAVYLVDANTASEVLMAMTALDQMARQSTRVGEDGVFLFERLPEGTYTIVAEHELYPRAQSPLIVLGEAQNERNVVVTLGSGGGVEGYVYRDGRPMPNATVIVIGTASTRNVTTDNNGYYIADELPPGTYQVMVTSLSQSDGIGLGMMSAIYDRPSASVEIEEGRMARQDFGTGEGTTVEGRVSPRPGIFGGQAVLLPPGAFIGEIDSFVSLENMLSGYGQGINSSGEFSIGNVPPGEWQLHIFYLEPGGVSPAPMPRYVYTELLQITDEDVIPLDIFVGL